MAGNEQNEFANMNYRQAKALGHQAINEYYDHLMGTNATMQEIIKEGNKVRRVDEQGYSAQMERFRNDYVSVQEKLLERTNALGLKQVVIEDIVGDSVLSRESVRARTNTIAFRERRHQVEWSGKKKKRYQEEDARNRAGDAAVANMIQCAGQNASLVGKAYEEKKKNGIPYQPMDNWSEVFTLSPHVQTDPAGQADMIANLMRFRDAHAELLKNTPHNTFQEKVPYRYNKEFVEYANDAIKTWQAAGGYDENGKRISAMARKRAQKHLPLAIEKYTHHLKNQELILGRYNTEFRRQRTNYQEIRREREERMRNDTRRELQMDMVLTGEALDAMRETQIIISENEEAYRNNKSVIKELYEEMVQHAGLLSDVMIDASALAESCAQEKGHFRGEASYQQDVLVYQMDLHKFALSAIKSYIEYLLTGRTPLPEQAIYIEQRWHVSIGGLSLDRVPAEKLNLEQRLRDRMNAIENDATMPVEYRNRANQVYDRAQSTLDTVMGGLNVLEQTTRVALDRASISKQMKLGAPKYDDMGGYRDLVRLVVPFEAEEITLNKKTAAQEGEAATQENEMVTMEGKKATMDLDEIMKFKKALYRVDTGMQYVENRSASGELKKPLKGADCSAAELEADARKVLEVVIEAKKDMDAFRAAHQKAFEPLNVDEAFEHAETLNLFGKKMQPIRDVCNILATSKAYIGFDEELQKQIKELWDYGAAWMDYVQDRTEFCNLAGYKNLRGLMEEGTNVNVDKLKTTYEEWYERRKQEHTNLLNEKRALYTRNSGSSNPDAAAS